MAKSEHLRDLKEVWGNSCHSMWAELFSISVTEATILGRYSEIGKDELINDFFYSPQTKNRLGRVMKDDYLIRASGYKASVITNRIIILSASFELYLNNFIDSYIERKPKFYDKSTQKRTLAGDKLYGEVTKVRGLSARIKKMADIAPFNINLIQSVLIYLDDLYQLRNILAHRAGLVDAQAAQSLNHLQFNLNDRVVITPEQMMLLARPIMIIAEFLDRKLNVEA